MTSVEEIEGDRWPDPGPESTGLVRLCTAARRKPLTDLSVEDLRIMLGQEIGVPILLPRAVEVLAADLLAEGDYYPGDLLMSVLRLPPSAWTASDALRDRLVTALAAMSPGQDLPKSVRAAITAFSAERR